MSNKKFQSLSRLFNVMLFLFSGTLVAAETTRTSIAKVHSVQGKAWLVSLNENQPKKEVKGGALIERGDSLLTDSNTNVKVVLGDKDVALWVKGESRLQLNGSQSQGWVLSLEKGMLLSQVRNRANQSAKHFQLLTRSATIGAQGAGFFVKSEAKSGAGEGVSLCTCDGLVALDQKVLIRGNHHDSPRWIEAGKESIVARVKPTPVGKDHSDAEMTELESLLR